MPIFEEEYKKLNKEQKEAVDSIEGPVMVVAGPGTGKTQVLALRIGNILKNIDTPPDGILCLTFTNAGVRAMRERLYRYIGPTALRVKISTFHSFGMDLISEYFRVLGKETAPKLLDEKDSVLLCDAILENNSWEYIRPRGDTSRYFKDLKSLISILKRERVSSDELINDIKVEITDLENDPSSVASRGARKGELKKEVEQKIAGLYRTIEAIQFFDLYEQAKEEQNALDYDDVLEKLIEIIENSDVVKAEIKENNLYILVDEHQDSSGLQNQFLRAVWGDEENPNIFVVGDDRQLIYGFGGASLKYFEEFKHTFGKAKLISLTENYRSTQNILDTSHDLLQSSIVGAKLKSNHPENHPLNLVEADYERDEIIAFGLEVKSLINQKKDPLDPNSVVLLLPKNRHVRSAIAMLHDMGIPVSRGENLDFFDSIVAQSFVRVLEILAYPNRGEYIASSFFDPLTKINPIDAHMFLRNRDMRNFSLLDVIENTGSKTLFKTNTEIHDWIEILRTWLKETNNKSLYSLIQKIGNEFLLQSAENHEELLERVEVVRTMLHLVLNHVEKKSDSNLLTFVEFLARVKDYDQSIPMVLFAKDEGVKVMTLHSSKGLEFDYVWVAHMDQRSLTSQKHSGFTLPEKIKEKIEKEDEEVYKRQLYVAITRAKRFCTISYALHSYTGGELHLADIILPLESYFEKQNAKETEVKILAEDPKSYVSKHPINSPSFDVKELVKLIQKEYEDKTVSVSLLNNFFECPWKWYFRNLLQLPEEKSPTLEFGTKIHGAIDFILQKGELPEENYYMTLSPDDQKKAQNIVSKWYQERYKELAKNCKNEESISLSDEDFPNLKIYGKLDLIEILEGDKVRVTDFKTGSGRKGSEIEKIDEEGRMSDYMRQLAMYSYLLSHNRKWKKDVAESVLEFLEAKKDSDRFYRTYITDEQIELLKKDIHDYNQLLKTGEWVSRPCHFKSYGKANSVCEYCQMAEIYSSR